MASYEPLNGCLPEVTSAVSHLIEWAVPVLVVAALWVAALWFGADTRDGRDRRSQPRRWTRS